MNKNNTLSAAASWIGGLVALVALLAYGLTLSPVFYPGDSSFLLAHHLNLMPFPPMANLIWNWVVDVVAWVPLGSLAVRMNAFNALCAAGCVYLLFMLVRDQRWSAAKDPHAPVVPESIRTWAAVIAAVYFACSIPVWVAATRAHPMAFDVLLALLTFRLLQKAAQRNTPGLIYLSVLVYGLALTEYSTMVALGPVLGIALLVVLLRQGRLRFGVIFGLLGVFLIGLSPYFIAAWLYMQHDAYTWREFTSYGLALKYIWLEQWNTLTRGLPRVGWLTMGMLTTLPWFIVFAYRLTPRPRTSAARLGQTALHLLIGGIFIAVLWDVPLSPWRLSRGSPLLIMPYVFAAIGMGLVGAFLMERMLPSRGQPPGPGSRLARTALGLLLVALSAVLAVRHLPVTSGRTGVVAAQHNQLFLDSLGDRDWLLTTGENDGELALLARQQGRRVTLINTRNGHIQSYQNYLASLFDDARLQSLARVSLAALLKEWLDQPGVLARVGVMSSPDLWEAMGYQAMPEGLLYMGEPNDATRDPTPLVEQFLAMAAGHGRNLVQASERDRVSPAARWNLGYRLEFARQANNLGVYTEDQGKPELAATLYREALRFNTNNISALINLAASAKRLALPDQAELDSRLEAMVKEQESSYTVWSLSRLHGYVRAPEMFASRGWAWAISGKPGMAVREIKRAIRSGANTPAAQMALAQMYFAQEDDKSSEDIYRKMLAVNPDHAPAILGLARLAARQGDFAEARRGLARLRQLNISPETLNLEEAMVEAMAGDLDKAAKLLADVLKRQPDNQRALMIRAVIAFQQGDTKQADEALARLQGMRNLAPPLRLALAQIAFSRKNFQGARRLLEDVLRAQPTHVAALDLMVKICQTEGNRDQVELYLNRLLSADPGHAYGNYLLGTLQYLREQYALAESSYRASLASRRTPETLNAIAYLRYLKGDLVESETLVREALKEDDGLANAWDTLANILIKRNQLNEAGEALQKAMALLPNYAGHKASLVRLYEAQGRREDAVKLADELLLKASELAPGEVQSMREVLKRLRGSV